MKRSIADIVRAAEGDDVDSDRVLDRVGARLRRAVAVDGWCALSLDPASLVKTGGAHGAGLPEQVLGQAIELEYAPSEVNRFAELARHPSPVAVLDEATEGDPEVSRRFRELMAPAGYRHELRLVLRERGRTWGGFTLLRRARTGPFLPAERRLLAALSSPLAAVLRRGVLRAAAAAPPAGDEPDHLSGGGLVLVEPDGSVAGFSAGAQRWRGRRLPLAVRALAAYTRQTPSGTGTVRCLLPELGWSALSGWRWETGQVAVAVQPARTEHLSALLLDAYGLSARERQVTELVLRGSSTGQIAAGLHLSRYTVQDHLRAVFVKTGLPNRHALLAELLFRRSGL